jgi:hypothetical protein
MSENQTPHRIRWSWFKIFITLILMGLSIVGIYFAIQPLIEGDKSLKSFANLAFVLVILFFMFTATKLRKNYEWVFWACGFGLIIFCSIMFINHDSIF